MGSYNFQWSSHHMHVKPYILPTITIFMSSCYLVAARLFQYKTEPQAQDTKGKSQEDIESVFI